MPQPPPTSATSATTATTVAPAPTSGGSYLEESGTYEFHRTG
ncbi:MAG TPA: hypothetical protein VGJ86_21475 [Acidimicrobiales bacterium]